MTTKYMIYKCEFESRTKDWPYDDYTICDAFRDQRSYASEPVQELDTLEELKEAIKGYRNTSLINQGTRTARGRRLQYDCTIYWAAQDHIDDDGYIDSSDIVDVAPDMPSYVNYYGRREWCAEVKTYTIYHDKWVAGQGLSYSEPVDTFLSDPHDYHLISADALEEWVDNYMYDDPDTDYTSDMFRLVELDDDTEKELYTYEVK